LWTARSTPPAPTPAAWVGGTAPALTVTPIGKSHINMTDLQSATLARAALGITVDTSKGHLVPTGSAPTVAAQAAAGTSPTATVSGRDTAGTITLTSGTGTPATGNQVILTFNQAFATAPVVVLAPGSAALAALHPYVAASTTTTFTVGFGVAVRASAQPLSVDPGAGARVAGTDDRPGGLRPRCRPAGDHHIFEGDEQHG
jgi:hypothetical protein